MLAPTLATSSKEDSKQGDDKSNAKKKKKNKKDVESYLSSFIPADKHKFYVP